jgi:hypothetical protein
MVDADKFLLTVFFFIAKHLFITDLNDRFKENIIFILIKLEKMRSLCFIPHITVNSYLAYN